MAKLLYKLGKFIAKNKWLSVIGWLVILGVIITPLMINSPKFDSDITMNGLKSLDTNDKISKEFHQDSEKASMKIVFILIRMMDSIIKIRRKILKML